MAKLVVATFSDTAAAGRAVAELQNKGYTQEISVVSRDIEAASIDPESSKIATSTADAAAQGGIAGAVAGGLVTLLAGVTAVTIPALGVVIAGSLASALAGAATGALVGGLAAALVNAGLSDTTAQEYEERVKAGDTLVTVSVDEGKEGEVQSILQSYGAGDVDVAG